MILLVHLEVLSEVNDTSGQESDLNLRRTGVGFVNSVSGNDVLLLDYYAAAHYL